MDKYIIEKAYHWTKDDDIRITGDNIEYIEMGNMRGCQSNNLKESAKITELCSQVADLIREIDKYNNILPF